MLMGVSRCCAGELTLFIGWSIILRVMMLRWAEISGVEWLFLVWRVWSCTQVTSCGQKLVWAVWCLGWHHVLPRFIKLQQNQTCCLSPDHHQLSSLTCERDVSCDLFLVKDDHITRCASSRRCDTSDHKQRRLRFRYDWHCSLWHGVCQNEVAGRPSGCYLLIV